MVVRWQSLLFPFYHQMLPPYLKHFKNASYHHTSRTVTIHMLSFLLLSSSNVFDWNDLISMIHTFINIISERRTNINRTDSINTSDNKSKRRNIIITKNNSLISINSDSTRVVINDRISHISDSNDNNFGSCMVF